MEHCLWQLPSFFSVALSVSPAGWGLTESPPQVTLGLLTFTFANLRMGVPDRMGRAPMTPDPCWDKGAAAVDIHRVKSSYLHFKEGRRPWRAGVKFLALLLPLWFRLGGRLDSSVHVLEGPAEPNRDSASLGAVDLLGKP